MMTARDHAEELRQEAIRILLAERSAIEEMLRTLSYQREAPMMRGHSMLPGSAAQEASLIVQELDIPTPRQEEAVSSPSSPANVIRVWDHEETRFLEQARLEGRYDAQSQVYVLDSCRWRIQGQVSRAKGEPFYTLVRLHE